MALMTVHKVTALPATPTTADALFLLIRDTNKFELYMSDSTGANIYPLTLSSTAQLSPLMMFIGGDNAS